MIALLRLCRLHFALPMASILTLTIAYAAGDDFADMLWSTLYASIALALVISGGYALNDVCDRCVDRVNAPERPLPSGHARPGTAVAWAMGLMLAGLLVGMLCRWQFSATLAVVAVVLVAYDLTSKRIGIGKQLVVALLMTSFYPLAFALVGHTASPRADTLFVFPAWLFLTSFGFEILADLRDVPGDLGVVSRPNWLQKHPDTARLAARSATIVGALLLVLPGFLGCGWAYWLSVPPAVACAAWSASSAKSAPRRARIAIYAECVIVGVGATADLVVLGR